MNPGNRITPCDRELPNRASTFSRYQLGCHHENAHDDTKSLPGEELRTGDLLDDMRHSRVNSCAPERTVALQRRIVVSRANRCAHPNGCPRSRMVALMSEGVRPVAVRWPSGGCPVARSCVRSRSHRGKLPNRSPRNASGSTLCPPLASPAWAVCTSRTQDPGAQLPRSASPDLASKTDRPNRLHGSPGIGIPLASASPNTRGLLTGLLLTSRSAPSSRAQARSGWDGIISTWDWETAWCLRERLVLAWGRAAQGSRPPPIRCASRAPPGVRCYAAASRVAATAGVVLAPPVSPAACPLAFARGRPLGGPRALGSALRGGPLAWAPRDGESAIVCGSAVLAWRRSA